MLAIKSWVRKGSFSTAFFNSIRNGLTNSTTTSSQFFLGSHDSEAVSTSKFGELGTLSIFDVLDFHFFKFKF